MAFRPTGRQRQSAEELAARNAGVDADSVRAVSKLIQELEQRGVTQQGYALRSPYEPRRLTRRPGGPST